MYLDSKLQNMQNTDEKTSIYDVPVPFILSDISQKK